MQVYFYEPEHCDDGIETVILDWPVLPQVGTMVKLKKIYRVKDVCITQPISGATGELYQDSMPYAHIYLENAPAEEN